MNKKHKKHSIASLIIGYALAVAFLLLIFLHQPQVIEIEPGDEIVAVEDVEMFTPTPLVEAVSPEVVFIDRPIYSDRLTGIKINDIPEVYTATVHDDHNIHIDTDRNIHIDTDRNIHFDTDGSIHVDRNRHALNTDTHIGRGKVNNDRVDVELVDDVDFGLLDRRLTRMDDVFIDEDDHINRKVGGESRERGNDLSKLNVDRGEDQELGNLDIDQFDGNAVDVGYGTGKGGELYAYNFPSYGVGAGVSSGAVGAGGGLGAGISAGVGQGLMGGEAVPTLGGVGSYEAPGTEAMGGGTGGLSSGAGAGAAAGLMTGKVIQALGIGAPGGSGKGDGGYSYDHLPKDGALHIMMHVDGSGSILNTRKQLEIMKDTLLKKALLPYYNNDAELYDRRVTIISSSGERTLRFFEEASKKDNVLAIAFQDEAQPAYHLPNFNKKPEDHYLDDMKNLKVSLNGYAGLYRGVMFQVDRGKTFAKSFKEFVNNSFRGEGYLASNSLKKYYRDNNSDNIRNKDGIVFSDEYHAKDSGDPAYYLDLILSAAARVGLDLKTNSGGLTDGKHVY